MALFPTKKIAALASFTPPLTGDELLECVQLSNSRKVTSRAFVLPTDSLITVSDMSGTLTGSRRLIGGTGIDILDSGPGSTIRISASGAVAGGANPTGTVGLAAVNGVASTYMRSDAAPPLNQGITPVWTGTHRWGNGGPILLISSSGAYNSRAVGALTAAVQIDGTGNSTSSLSIVRNNASQGGGFITLGKSRDNAVNGITIINSGDIFGEVDFAGANGVDLVSLGAKISAIVDGVPDLTSMPGRLVFSTTPATTIVPVERFRISNLGAWGLSGAVYGDAGQVLASAGNAAPPVWQAPTVFTGVTTTTTVGAAGGASALPATPTGYMAVVINGTTRKIPYYNT